MLGKPTGFWAKLKRNEDGAVSEWHSLLAHSADVAAMFEALVTRTILGRRLAALAGVDALTEVEVARLCYLAAIHDAGKANHAFQDKATGSDKRRAGHLLPMIAMLRSGGLEERLRQALGLLEADSWLHNADAMLRNTWSHHGKPITQDQLADSRLWVENDERDPIAELERISRHARDWFPAAFGNEGRVIDGHPPFQHAFNGVLTLADWLGSDTRFFEFSDETSDPIRRSRSIAADVVQDVFLDPSRAREQLGDRPVDFSSISEYEPYDIQRACLDLPTDRPGSIVVLEAETGSGKTEAAIARFLSLFQSGQVDGLYFAVPTRAAATQLHRRVLEATQRAFPDATSRPGVNLAVPGYIRVDDRSGRAGPGFDVQWDDDEGHAAESGSSPIRGWASERPKRFLAGAIVVGTIDQVLLSALQVKHAHMRAAALLRHLVVIDEVHASDTYMTNVTERVLASHLVAGGHAMLMSATLGGPAREQLVTGYTRRVIDHERAESMPYPMITYRDTIRPEPIRSGEFEIQRNKHVWLSALAAAGDPSLVAKAAIRGAQRGARVLVIRNTVRDCVQTQSALEEVAGRQSALLFGIGGVAAPHHSRFSRDDRRLLDNQVEARFGKDSPSRGIALVATQTVEQSLDIDADVLITDICPIDVLLQRIGRLHRHDRSRPRGYDRPRCLVLVPADRDLSAFIKTGGRARARHGLGTVYPDLRMTEATWRLLDGAETKWSIPDDNRRLVEQGTHPHVLSEIASSLGPDWIAHQHYIAGESLADQLTAQEVLIDWDRPFGEDGFPEDGGKIRTRLGSEGYDIEFADPPIGPFGERVHGLAIPDHMMREPPETLVAHDVHARDRGFVFKVGGSAFSYGKNGLY